MALDPSILFDKLSTQFGQALIDQQVHYHVATAIVDKNKNMEVLQFLYEDPALQFTFLTDITAVHYPEALLPLCVVYHLHSLTTNTRLRIKCYLPVEQPHIRTATTLFAGANWMERETYDFYGVQFEGHPNLKRILNVDDMDVYPMRKEFPLEDPNRVDKKDEFFGR